MVRVLVVDDEQFVIDASIMHLRLMGVEAVGALGWMHVATMMAQHSPEMMLVDIHMPGLDGENLAALVKRRWPDVMVLIHSASPVEERVAAMLASGADGHVLKGSAGIAQAVALLDERRELEVEVAASGRAQARS